MASQRAARLRAPPFVDPPGYVRHRPEAALLYQLVDRYYPELVATRETAGRPLPKHVQEEFEAYLKCDRFEHGFLRVRCVDCHAEKLVEFSCKWRCFYPSCGARRMSECAALLADEVLPSKPLRQWVLSLPFALRFLLATDPKALTHVLGIVYRTISAYVFRRARLTRATGAIGAVARRACGAARGGDAGRSRAGGSRPGRHGRACDAAARGDELGGAAQAGVRHRDRAVRALRRAA
jgi:hypothetical protein